MTRRHVNKQKMPTPPAFLLLRRSAAAARHRRRLAPLMMVRTAARTIPARSLSGSSGGSCGLSTSTSATSATTRPLSFAMPVAATVSTNISTDGGKYPFELMPLTGALGAEIQGASLKASALGPEEKAAIRRAFLRHGVLVFRGQEGLSNEDLLAVAEVFGPVEPRPVVKAQYGLPMVHDLVREPGTLGRYGEVWHADCSYMKAPPLGALLYAVEVPAFGNDTIFANLTLALEALSPPFRRMLEPLRAVHSAFKMVERDPKVASAWLLFGLALFGGPRSSRSPLHHNTQSNPNQGEYLEYDKVDHPVIRTHPETGAQSLFVNPFFTTHFVGMTEAESKPILDHLFSLLTRAELQCRVRYERGSLVVWDNRCVAHQAIRDNAKERRVMRRVEMQGDVPRGV